MEMTHVRLDEVDSTNTYAKLHFEGLPDGALISADCQTAGRGRLDRKWYSPRGVNIYASFVMKQISNPFYATIVASISVLDTLLTLCRMRVFTSSGRTMFIRTVQR